MNNYTIKIEIPDGEVSRLLNELQEAQEKIYSCYSELEQLGVITIKKIPPAATDGITDQF